MKPITFWQLPEPVWDELLARGAAFCGSKMAANHRFENISCYHGGSNVAAFSGEGTTLPLAICLFAKKLFSK